MHAFAPPAPNPFGVRAVLNCSTPAVRRASLRVYDLQDQLVRTLIDEPSLTAGAHHATWNGHDAEGARMSPGTHLVRVATCDAVVTRRPLMAK